LLDLKPEEELQLTHHAHLNSLLMSSTNLATRELEEPPKIISYTYTCTIRIYLPCLRRNKV
jgi:hypothetical protein